MRTAELLLIPSSHHILSRPLRLFHSCILLMHTKAMMVLFPSNGKIDTANKNTTLGIQKSAATFKTALLFVVKCGFRAGTKIV